MPASNPMPVSKIGIIGDIHAEATQLLTTLNFLQNLHLQAILCVGDLVDGRESVDTCCDLLQSNAVVTVRGNHDNWFLANEQRDMREATQPHQVSPAAARFIASLPDTKEIQTTAGALLLCHGIGANDMAKLTPDDYGYALEANIDLQNLLHAQQYRFIVNGHTHRRMVRSFTGLTVINAGTLKREHNPCFATVDFDEKLVQFYDINQDAVISPGENYKL